MAAPSVKREVSPVETVTAPIVTSPDQERIAHMSDVDRMRSYFKGRPREKIRVRKDEGNQFVQINGYGFQIMAGETVEVPTDVADLLREANII